MPGEKAAPRRRRPASGARPPASALAVLGFFILLGVTAWPAARHHWMTLEGDVAIAALEAGRPLTAGGFERALTSRADALAVLEVASTRRDLGLARLRRALQPGGLDEPAFPRVVHDDERLAEWELRAAVARAPADHFAWYYLALAAATSDQPALAAAALSRAVTFAPYHPPIRRARVRLGLDLWDDLDAGSRDLILADLAATLRSRR